MHLRWPTLVIQWLLGSALLCAALVIPLPAGATPVPPEQSGQWSSVVLTSIDGGRLLVVSASNTGDLVSVASSDGGANWSQPVTVGANGSRLADSCYVLSSCIVADPQLQRVALLSEEVDGSLVVYRSRNGGGTWATPVTALTARTDVQGAGTVTVQRSLDLESLTIRRVVRHFSPHENDPDIGEVSASEDFGGTWRQRPNESPIVSGGPIAVTPDGRHAASIFTEVSGATYLAVSHDMGATWASRDLPMPGADLAAGAAAISDDGQTIAVTVTRNIHWTSEALWHSAIEVIASRDGGTTFDQPTRLGTAAHVIDTLSLKMTADGRRLFTLWDDSGSSPMRSAVSQDSALTWEPAAQIDVPEYGVDVLGDVDGRLVLIGNEAVRQSTDGGRTWSEPTPMPPAFGEVQASADSRVLARIWPEYNGVGWVVAQRMASSSDYGKTWTEPTQPPWMGATLPVPVAALVVAPDGAAVSAAWSPDDRVMFSTRRPAEANWSPPVQLLRQTPSVRPTPATRTTLKVRARGHGKRLPVGKRTRVVRGWSTDGTTTVAATCLRLRHSLKGRKGQRRCGIIKQQRALTVMPRCSTRSITVTVLSKKPGARATTWRRTWKTKHRGSC